jgi:TolB-like protein
MNRRLTLLWSVPLLVPLLLAGCASQVVKGNIYRKGFKDGKLSQVIERFNKGSFAIFPFKGIYENRMSGIATDGNAIADLISIQMLYRGYKVMERDKMQKILEEKAFKESDLAASAPSVNDSGVAIPAPVTQKPAASTDFFKNIPENSEQYIKMGKMLGVDFIVSGSIIQYEYQLTKGGLFRGGSVSLAVTVTTRIIDVENGDIIFAMSAGTDGNNLPEALDGITTSFTDALREGKVYVWE